VAAAKYADLPALGTVGAAPKRADMISPAAGRRYDRSDRRRTRMRKVVVYELLSLDGVAEGPDDFITDWDELMGENLERVIGTQDGVLLGRRTYDEWAQFWPTRTTSFANFINTTTKLVVTSTPLAHDWANATVVGGDVTTFITELKQQPGGDIGVHGSIALTQSLLEAGLVDELRLVVAPAIQMHGRKLFERGMPKRLSVTRNVTSPSGYLLIDLRFER
jgi:dihydrofolate reductase